MREILFRGQTRRKGQKVWMDGSPVEGNWVYGGVCHGTGDFSIIYGNLDEERERPTEKWVVYTDTVGQFTGLTDKNGKKIFEGDIIMHYNRDDIPTAFDVGKIFWDAHKCRWLRTSLKCDYNPEVWGSSAKGYVVIGNIHDNPELLGGVEDD